jgi:predicted ATPase/DNA-binding winged helix-turn-helix (wHTH) protein
MGSGENRLPRALAGHASKVENVSLPEPASGEPGMTFGAFQLFPGAKLLSEADRPVRLGGRAMQILLELVGRAGKTVSKRELIARVWPGSSIEESNLRVHITALRRVLGDGRNGARYIVNDSGRGYRFVAPIRPIGRAGAPAPADTLKSSLLPPLRGRLVGRDETIRAIADQVLRRRMVTLAGSGGVGKTAVAVAVAHRVLDSASHSVVFVDLAAIDAPALVPATLATSIGVSIVTSDPLGSLVAVLGDSRILLVLDNCEHLIGQVAALVEKILKGTTHLRILTTSREPLLTEREWVYRIPPLPVPAETGILSAAEAMRSSAVQLFVELAGAGGDSFALTDSNVETVIRICRGLDGLPLALELVAAQLHVFGLEGLAAQLSDHLLLLTRGRRPTRPQHESIHSMLDWSYGMLCAQEQKVLRALTVFKSAFPIESAAAVAFGGETAPGEVLETLLSLAEKSFIITDVSGPDVLYRLLHVTRAYASEKLVEAHEQGIVSRRHAERCCVVLDIAQAEWESMTREEWLSRYRYMMDDVRAALDWAFSAGGDLDLGVSLTTASLPFGFQLCQIAEFKRRAELALERLAHASPPRWVAELRLNVALGALYKNTEDSEERFLRAYARAEELADRVGVGKYKVETLVARTVSNLERGDTPAALAASEELLGIAARTSDPVAQLIADRAAAQATHFAGQQARAREFAARVLAHPARSIPLAYSHAAIDRRVWMRIVQARALWLEGLPDQATLVAEESLLFAASDGPFAKCQALALAAAPIAFWRGDLAVARRLVEELVQHCRRYTLSRWLKLGLCYELAAAALIGDSASSVHGGSHGPFAWPANPLHYDLLATICDDWVDTETIHRAERGLSGWCVPEVLRVAGELTLRSGEPSSQAKANGYFRRSLQIAAEQQALAWELRTTISLARLWQNEGRSAQARAALAAVSARFREGFGTADLILARRLLDTA